jgi:hypothetical protein
VAGAAAQHSIARPASVSPLRSDSPVSLAHAGIIFGILKIEYIYYYKYYRYINLKLCVVA